MTIDEVKEIAESFSGECKSTVAVTWTDPFIVRCVLGTPFAYAKDKILYWTKKVYDAASEAGVERIHIFLQSSTTKTWYNAASYDEMTSLMNTVANSTE